VRPPLVIFLPPIVDRGLRFPQGGEWPGIVEELNLQGLMPPFDFAGRGGRRVGLGEQLPDAVAAADPLEQHLRRAGLAESPGELLAVVSEHFVGDAVGPHRLEEPEISFSSVPSVRNTDPVISICHSCIGASRCHRL
jgi:hypothetical protein